MEFPAEYWIELDGYPHFIGRLTVIKINSLKGILYNVEIDLMLEESRKIYRHLDSLYNIEALDEAIELGRQVFAKSLRVLSSPLH